MKKIIYIFFIVLILIGCKVNASKRKIASVNSEIRNYYSTSEVDSLISRIEDEIADLILTEFSLKNMHPCGGSVQGFYNTNGELIKIHSMYQGDSGYIERKVYFKENDKIYKFYQEYFPNQDKNVVYYRYHNNKFAMNDLSKERCDLIFGTFISDLDSCINDMEKKLILEYKTKD